MERSNRDSATPPRTITPEVERLLQVQIPPHLHLNFPTNFDLVKAFIHISTVPGPRKRNQPPQGLSLQHLSDPRFPHACVAFS